MTEFGRHVRETVVRNIEAYRAYGEPEISDDDSLHGVLGLDSIDRLEILMELERELAVPLDDVVWDATTTVGDLIEAIQRHDT